jgi:internalin A
MDNDTANAVGLKRINDAAANEAHTLILYPLFMTKLPGEVGKLTSLTAFDLSFNNFVTLPPELWQLTNLVSLNLSNNKLLTLSSGIGQLTNLSFLDLSNNNLSALPPELLMLKNLKKLNVQNNKLDIPPEITDKVNEPQSILNYLEWILNGRKRTINETKLLIVGQGSVGKTSLVKRLTSNQYNPQQTKTDGISIDHWQIGSRFLPTSIQLNIWDFGGQEIMHATHQFFLTKRSLYLLVLDSRLTQEENRVEYWLKIIQSFGGESPILIIGNKTDQHHLDIDRTGLQKKYHNIVGILETSAATGAGVEELRKAITEQVHNLPHVRDFLPETWFSVKTKLEAIGREKNYISQENYLGLCLENEVTDETSQHTLVGFMHDLGVVLYFQEDRRLSELGILNPQWVTNGVYKILNSHNLFQNKGVLTVSMLDEILNLPEYPRGKRLFIVDMMKKFELCYDIEPDKTFLVPDLLPKDQPEINFNGIPAFEYAYPVLPSSIITRFIVRMNQHICDSFVWRTGVLLKIGENKALVKADVEDRKITIAIDGLEHTRRDTLSAIRYQLDEIHTSIKGLEPQKRVPIPNAPNAEPLEYEYLLMLEREGQEYHLVKDGNRLVKVNVRQILSGIELEAERRESGSQITQIYISGDINGSTIVAGNENQIKSKRSFSMDIPVVAASVTSALAPFFPYIIKGVKLAGQKWFESLGEKAGEQAADQAGKVWQRIKENSSENKTIEGAAMMLSETPENESVQKIFSDALADVMRKHPGLTQELVEYQKTAPSLTINQNSGGVYFQGSGNVSIGGDVAGRDLNKG